MEAREDATARDVGTVGDSGAAELALAWARAYTRLGGRVVPIPPRQKGPVVRGWQKMRPTPDKLPCWFGQGAANVGILTSEASGRLVDVDCDTPEAARAAAVLLPPTGTVSGRPSNPASHW